MYDTLTHGGEDEDAEDLQHFVGRGDIDRIASSGFRPGESYRVRSVRGLSCVQRDRLVIARDTCTASGRPRLLKHASFQEGITNAGPTTFGLEKTAPASQPSLVPALFARSV